MGKHWRAAAAAAVATMAIGGGLAQATSKLVKVKAGPYAGMTSEKIPVTFTVSGRSIKTFRTQIGYNGRCGQGGGPGYAISVASIALKRDGSFSAKVTLVGPVAIVKSVRGTLTGKASGSSVHGTIVDLATAKQKCNGYTATFTASFV